MSPIHANKGGRRYRYYVSRKLVRGSAVEAETGWRLAGAEIERSVAASIGLMLGDGPAITEVLERAALSSQETVAILKAAADSVAKRSRSGDDVSPAALSLVNRIGLRKDGMELDIDLAGLLTPAIHHGPLILNRFVPVQIKRRGVELRLVIGGETSPAPRGDPTLLKAVARGYRWFNELISGKSASAAAIAKREGLRKQYVGRFIPLAFLAPTIVAAIVRGLQPAELNLEALTRADLPLDWTTQQRELAPV